LRSVSSSEDEDEDYFFFFAYFLLYDSAFSCGEIRKLNFYLNLYFPFNEASFKSLFQSSGRPFFTSFFPFGAYTLISLDSPRLRIIYSLIPAAPTIIKG